MVKMISAILIVIGGINWGLIGFFKFDLIAAIFGSQDNIWARIIFALVGIAAIIFCALSLAAHGERRQA